MVKSTGNIHKIRSKVDIARNLAIMYEYKVGPIYRYWLEDSILMYEENDLEVMFTV